MPLRNGDRLVPEPVLVGRNADKLSALAAAHGGLEWSADRAATLADKTIEVYFDSAATGGRLDRALAYLQQVKDLWPPAWQGFTKEQLDRLRTAEKYHLQLVKLRYRELAAAPAARASPAGCAPFRSRPRANV